MPRATRWVDGLRVACVDTGPRDADAIVLLHGYFGSAATWRHVVPALARNNRVIAPDWPGWGQSERSPRARYDYAREVARIALLLDACDVPAADLVVHDYGAHLALGFCLAYPHRVRRLCLLNSRAQRSFVPAWAAVFGFMGALGRLPGAAGAYRMLPIAALHRHAVRRERRMGILDDATLAEYGGWVTGDPTGRAYLARFFADYRVATRNGLVDGLARIDCPTAIIWGERDPFIPLSTAHELAHGIPGATLRLLPEAGHFVAEETPEVVIDTIRTLRTRPLAAPGQGSSDHRARTA